MSRQDWRRNFTVISNPNAGNLVRTPDRAALHDIPRHELHPAPTPDSPPEQDNPRQRKQVLESIFQHVESSFRGRERSYIDDPGSPYDEHTTLIYKETSRYKDSHGLSGYVLEIVLPLDNDNPQHWVQKNLKCLDESGACQVIAQLDREKGITFPDIHYAALRPVVKNKAFPAQARFDFTL